MYYKRHGTTTLFAALDVLEGKVIGRGLDRLVAQCRRGLLRQARKTPAPTAFAESNGDPKPFV